MTRAGELFDKIIAAHGLRSDAAFAERLEAEPSYISLLRRGRKPLGPDLILRIHDAFGIPIADIKRALGMRCLDIAPACRIPTRAEALAQFVVQQFRSGALSQRKAAEAA